MGMRSSPFGHDVRGRLCTLLRSIYLVSGSVVRLYAREEQGLMRGRVVTAARGEKGETKKSVSLATYRARSITEGPAARKRRPVPPPPVIRLHLHNISGRSAAILHRCCQTPLYRPSAPEFVTLVGLKDLELDTRIAAHRGATRNAHR